jgi:CD2 antigen cytoplasmic tail-binding protein 2
MKRSLEKEDEMFEMGKSLSKRTKLIGQNQSVVKNRKFYGEEAMPEDEGQDDDEEENRFSIQAIHQDLEEQYNFKQRRKEKAVAYLKREQIEDKEAYANENAPNEPEEEEQDENKEDIKIEPFHLSRELEEGAFDEAGMYVHRKDKEATLDNWLQDIDKKTIRKAREAHEKQLQERTKKELEEHEKPINQWSREEIYLRLLEYMRPVGIETVAQTLKRLAQSKDKEMFQTVTELTHRLTMLGVYDVYECYYETIEQRSRPSSILNLPTSRTMWEYRWNETEDVYGPFKTQDMAQWQDQGYFPETLLVRKIQEGQKDKFVRISSLEPFSSFLSRK